MHALQVSLFLRGNTLRIDACLYCLASRIKRRQEKVAQKHDHDDWHDRHYCEQDKEATENRDIVKKSYHDSLNPSQAARNAINTG